VHQKAPKDGRCWRSFVQTPDWLSGAWASTALQYQASGRGGQPLAILKNIMDSRACILYAVCCVVYVRVHPAGASKVQLVAIGASAITNPLGEVRQQRVTCRSSFPIRVCPHCIVDRNECLFQARLHHISDVLLPGLCISLGLKGGDISTVQLFEGQVCQMQ